MDLKLFFLFFLKIIDRFFWVLNFLCLCSSLFFLKIKLGLNLYDFWILFNFLLFFFHLVKIDKLIFYI